ncbi:polyubiquitin-like isoform X2 [Scomber scombrus]|uniref:polyubiquitin-like isoform X2 n=1 Tax=Scomber scombrus TaxID=13677 RepID=UPI002DDC2F48|nr:polyubiquitin-like isoform X2 [Scomber scombrus]
MDINITMLDGTSLNLSVRTTDTVGSLKTLIQQKLGFAPEIQKLIIDNGERKALNDNSRSISSYGLHSGCQVTLLPPQPATIQVFLRNEKGKVSTYDIRPDVTVSDFKLKVEAREGVPVSQQRLNHQGREMSQGKLADYNVEALSTIDMTLRLRGG